MKMITWSGVAALLAGVATFVITSTPAADPFALRPSAGYVLFLVGLVTVLVDSLATRESKTAGLFFSGLVLIAFGEHLPAMIFHAIFGRDVNADFRDSGMIFLFLGVACILISWTLMVLGLNKQKNET